jgi:hypothetical protein
MPCRKLTLRALLVLMLAIGCFFGGIRFERERRRREDEAMALRYLAPPAILNADYWPQSTTKSDGSPFDQ